MIPSKIIPFEEIYSKKLQIYNGDFPGGSDGKASAYNAGDPGVRSLGWEDPLENEMAPHSSTLA